MFFNRKPKEENKDNLAATIVDSLEVLFHNISNKLNGVGLSVSLEELQSNYSEALDMIILREEDTNNCKYISGEFSINYLDEKSYNCAYELYFEDQDGQYHTLEAKTKPLFSTNLTKEFQQELKKEKEIKFELGEPSSENKRKYERAKALKAKESSLNDSKIK